MAVASRDCEGGTTAILLLFVAHEGGAGDSEWLKDVFCCFWIFLNLSCSNAAFWDAKASRGQAG